jgi:hypothetical protein
VARSDLGAKTFSQERSGRKALDVSPVRGLSAYRYSVKGGWKSVYPIWVSASNSVLGHPTCGPGSPAILTVHSGLHVARVDA